MKRTFAVFLICVLASTALAAITPTFPRATIDQSIPYHNLSDIFSNLQGQPELYKVDSDGNGIIDYADIAGGIQSGGVSVEVQGGNINRVAKYVANNVIGQSSHMTEDTNGHVSIGSNLWVGGTINGVQYNGPYTGSTAGSYYHLGSWGGNGWGPDVLVERARYSDSTYGGNNFVVWPHYADNAGSATYGRYVYNNGAYSGSGWVEPSDLGVRYANSANIATHAYYVDADTLWTDFHWAGQGGQPTWLWGSNDGYGTYVWNPRNFHVSYADNAGGAYGNLYVRKTSCSGTKNGSSVCKDYDQSCIGIADPGGAVGLGSCATKKNCEGFWNVKEGVALCYY